MMLRTLLKEKDPLFWTELKNQTLLAHSFSEIISLSTLRKKAIHLGFREGVAKKLKIAILSGYSTYPFHELLEQFLFAQGFAPEFFIGSYNNYVSEILESDSPLYGFNPEAILLIPQNPFASGGLSVAQDPETHNQEIKSAVNNLLELCNTANARTGADILLANFVPDPFHDLGAFRNKTLASDWVYKRKMNLDLGLRAPSFVHICDLEHLSARNGGLNSHDARGWFESKQVGTPEFLVEFSREAARLLQKRVSPPKKVLVLDLDNTVWGGIIGDDGLEGIELGDTSPRGEAFKAFQRYVLSLTERGILLGVCSKNDLDKATEPFEKHPEMVLKKEHIVSFKANWEPKPQNLSEIAAELNLGLDSIVFVDDNPAEIEIVRQFLPEVATILLGPDPSDYVKQLKDSRYFEPLSITEEDSSRTQQYKQEQQREILKATVVDMDAYLASLEMVATIEDFNPINISRITQLINKSNQFNLTTRRRSEGEVKSLLENPDYSCFTIRLADKFGDHGLIAILIAKKIGATFDVDSWIMSCRVLKRQVEDITLNELAFRASNTGCSNIEAKYLPTKKNGLVKDLLPTLGFSPIGEDTGGFYFRLNLETFVPKVTKISVLRKSK